ncbi:MAG TPA: four helix bundle protein [Candidatus Saccharimonadales bacterium]|nr:four helix bundle protein [Candidatus Saccharimonadales bacterium]
MAFRFEHLTIWTDANAFIGKIYKTTKKFPREELFSLTDQLRRSSSSIAANIAEGSGSTSRKDFCHYLDIAIKSLYETVSHLSLAKDQNYITEENRVDLYHDAEILVKKIQSFKKTLQI